MSKRRPSGDGMVRKREDGRWEGRIVVGHKENGEPIFRYVLRQNPEGTAGQAPPGHGAVSGRRADRGQPPDSGRVAGPLDGGLRRPHPAAQHPAQATSSISGATSSPAWAARRSPASPAWTSRSCTRKLKHEGRVHDHPEYGHELSDSMVLRIHAMLHRCLRDAETAHVILRNPAAGAMVPKDGIQAKTDLDPGTDGRLPGGGGAERSAGETSSIRSSPPACAGARSAASCGRTSTRGPGH